MTRALAAIVVASVLLSTTACTNELDSFCDQLDAVFDLTDLRRALNRDDADAVEDSLAELQELEDLAPEEIEAQVTTVVDAVVDTVRAVLDVEGPNGENMPVDTSQLNESLANVSNDAQQVVTFAEENCGISTSTTRQGGEPGS